MNLTELRSHLQARPALNVTIALPDGGRIPAHYHVTEVGQVVKRFVDCGGTVRTSESCVLQTYLSSPRDDGHRLTAGKLARILDLARPLLPSDDVPVEVEHENGVISQFPLTGVAVEGGTLKLQLGLKHTDCLAKDRCGLSDDAVDGAEEAGPCCAGATAGERCC
jgi:hypothetical protein